MEEIDKKCLGGCEEKDILINLYLNSIYGKLFNDLIGFEITETSYLCIKCRDTMLNFKDFKDRCNKNQAKNIETEKSTSEDFEIMDEFEEIDEDDRDDELMQKDELIIEKLETLKPNYNETGTESSKSLSALSQTSKNIRRLISALPKKANGAHLDIMAIVNATMCSFCFVDFKNITQLLEHLSAHTDNKITCPDCSCKFNNKDAMRCHYRKHLISVNEDLDVYKANQKDVNCQYCDKKYRSLALLDRHENKRHKKEMMSKEIIHIYNSSGELKLKKHVGSVDDDEESKELQEMTKKVAESRNELDLYNNFNIKLQCKFCCKMFTSPANRKQHALSHVGEEKPFKCPECPETFKLRIYLRNHYYKHTAAEKFICNIDNCKKQFHHKANLKSHQNGVHLEIRNFMCNFCAKSFRDKLNLTIHLRIHTNERPFKCSLCPSAFRTANHHRDHYRLHTGDLRYQCTFCEKKFVTSSKKNIHERWHTGIRPYPCIICSKAYSQKKLLKAHYASIHNLKITSFEIPNIDGSTSQPGTELQRPFKRVQLVPVENLKTSTNEKRN